MQWRDTLVAIRIPSDSASTHIVERYQVEPSKTVRIVNIKTYCGLPVVNPINECSEADIDCEVCIASVEKQQAYWEQFWTGAEGIHIIKILAGYNKLEAVQKQTAQDVDALYRNVKTLDDLLINCLQHRQPVFTLELPDNVLLKLVDYGSVGELLLAFKLSDDTRQSLKEKLGKDGIALIGSRLISKGLIKVNDPIFYRKW